VPHETERIILTSVSCSAPNSAHVYLRWACITIRSAHAASHRNNNIIIRDVPTSPDCDQWLHVFIYYLTCNCVLKRKCFRTGFSRLIYLRSIDEDLDHRSCSKWNCPFYEHRVFTMSALIVTYFKRDSFSTVFSISYYIIVPLSPYYYYNIIL